MMYALVVASVTRDGKYAFCKLSDDAYNDILYAFEQCLCYWAWLKKDFHWDRNDLVAHQTTKDAIAEMLRNLMTYVPRNTGRGWHIPKLHEQLHVADTFYSLDLTKMSIPDPPNTITLNCPRNQLHEHK